MNQLVKQKNPVHPEHVSNQEKEFERTSPDRGTLSEREALPEEGTSEKRTESLPEEKKN